MLCLHTTKSHTGFQSCIKRAPQPRNERAGGGEVGLESRDGSADHLEASEEPVPNDLDTYGRSAESHKMRFCRNLQPCGPEILHKTSSTKARHLRVRGRYVLEKVEKG